MGSGGGGGIGWRSVDFAWRRHGKQDRGDFHALLDQCPGLVGGGLTVDRGDWWYNLRPSNTEPLLRLNVEAPDEAACAARVAEVQEAIARLLGS